MISNRLHDSEAGRIGDRRRGPVFFHETVQNRSLWRIVVIGWVVAGMLTGCGGITQVHSKASHQSLSLQPGDLEAYGLAFITPSTVTGQEEEKQSVAFTFAEVLKRRRPMIRCVTLAETLSFVNKAGFSDEYREMYIDYRDTGIFKRPTLSKVADVTGTTYIAQLKLQGFHQGASGRFGVFGLRLVETKFATVRLFFQIWNAQQGTIAWEGIQELNLSVEASDERTVTLQAIVAKAAENLIARLPVLPE
jgi:hypothetical protein